ncbi:hypothetical protein N7481_008524 [Penicillium waksmanii]|uniref:uncharacterized protein n=1 Tax=Penicillium waksmanii TaxID=69791 RepID=UPI0025476092|nr:uncharacterized protein N7481_008524 [Penicillium waksmanii]KAJ5974817.1 hypothetical protein N7481_008524 [Penicillium waksmanii]
MFFKSFSSYLLVLSLPYPLIWALDPVQSVSEIGLGIWVENLAVRYTGQILAASLEPSLYQIDPAGGPPTVLMNFPPPITGIAGITETLPDVFYLAVGNISNRTISASPGTMSVWEVDLNQWHPDLDPKYFARKVVDFPEATMLDGMTTLNAIEGLILITDPVGGAIWSLNVETGAKQNIQLPFMKSLDGHIPALGVNGIKYADGALYCTSTDQQLFVRLPIDALGVPTGSPITIASGFGQPDDFALDEANNAYVAVNANSLVLIQPNGDFRTLAGGDSSTALAGITGAKFGRNKHDQKILYVSKTGGSSSYFTGNFLVPGGISKVLI